MDDTAVFPTGQNAPTPNGTTQGPLPEGSTLSSSPIPQQVSPQPTAAQSQALAQQPLPPLQEATTMTSTPTPLFSAPQQDTPPAQIPNQSIQTPPAQTVTSDSAFSQESQTPQPIQPVAAPIQGSFSPQAVSVDGSVPPAVNPSSSDENAPGGSQRITLEDLYGPSSTTTSPSSEGVPQENGASSQWQQPLVEPSAASQASFVSNPLPESTTPPQTAEENVTTLPTGNVFPSLPDTEENPGEASTPVQSVENQASASDSSDGNGQSSFGGGFHLPKFLPFLLGGLIIFIVLLLGITMIRGLFQPAPSGKVTLTYWGLWEDQQVMQGVISDFERSHPTISVNYVKQDPKQYTQRLLTRIKDGSGPDIFRFHNTWVTPLASILLPLPQTVLDKSTLEQQYPPVVSQDLVQNGALLGVPLEVDTLSLFVNKDIFTAAGAQVPTTWDEFVTVAKALTVKDPSGKIKTSGAALGTFDNIDHAPDIISLLMLQNGANLQKLNGSQNANDALTFYTSFANGTSNVWDNTLDNSLTAFERGNLAMFFGYSWDLLAIQAASPNLHIGVYPVPHLVNRNMTVASYWAEGISNKTAHPKEATEFLQYLAQKDTQTKLYTAEAQTRPFGELYARKDLAAGLTSNPLLSPFVSQAATAQSTFFVDGTDYDEFNGVLNGYLGNAVNSVLGTTSVDSALTTLSQGVSQVFNQYAQPTP